jgi:hypothetical protein
MDYHIYKELYGLVTFNDKAMWEIINREPFDDAITHARDLGLHDGTEWLRWPTDTCEHNVLRFVQETFQAVMPKMPGDIDVYSLIPAGDLIIKDGDTRRKSDLVVATTYGSNRNPLPGDQVLSWNHVRVIGEFKSNAGKSDMDSTLCQLGNYAREVFGAQPGRRWVLGFTLCGTAFRMWQFDRGGARGSTVVDIHEEWELFLATILSFATMEADALGFDPTIRCNERGAERTYDPTLRREAPSRPFIYLPRNLPGARQLSKKPVPSSIAAYSPSVWSKLEIYPTCISRRVAIATRGAVCWKARPWKASPRGQTQWTYVVKDQWRAEEYPPEGDLLGRCDCHTIGLPTYGWHADIMYHKSGVSCREDIPSIRNASGDGPSVKRADPEYRRKVSETGKSLFYATCSTENRVHTRLVIAPVGKPLLEFATYSELLIGFRDAIQGHRHMYQQHNVLHRDVSINNVLLVPTSAGSSCQGILIDFDLAIDTNREKPSGAGHRTGTFDFMAFEILGGHADRHTPLHDLESFFYTLLWICIYYGRGGKRDHTVKDTIFVSPSANDRDPYESAQNAKGRYRLQTQFMDFVLPTLREGARCLQDLLVRWHKIVSREYNRNDDIDWESVIKQTYQEVLGLLEEAISGLQGK